MKTRNVLMATAIAAAFGWSVPAFAHCDTVDGPVVSAARKALDTGNVDHVLIWVQPRDEGEIRDAFDRSRAVRKAGGAASDLADRYFYETLVRVHRAGEGAAYTGLKPAGHTEPPIAAADKALASGRIEDVASLITERMHAGLNQQYDAVVKSDRFDPSDVAAGRAHVGAYVTYVHYVERVYDAAGGTPDTEAAAAGAAPHAH